MALGYLGSKKSMWLNTRLTQVSQSQRENTSKVRVEVWLETNSYGWAYHTSPKLLSLSVDGQDLSAEFYLNITSNSIQKIVDKTITVSHNASGEKTVNLYVTLNVNVANYGSVRFGDGLVLTKIIRGNYPTGVIPTRVSSNETFSVACTDISSDWYTYWDIRTVVNGVTKWWGYKEGSNVIIDQHVINNTEIARLFPNTKECTIYLDCITKKVNKDGETLTIYPSEITMVLDNSFAITGSVTHRETDEFLIINDAVSYYTNISKIKIVPHAELKYGATLDKVLINGKKGDIIVPKKTIENVNVKIYDSRGFFYEENVNLNAREYSKPTAVYKSHKRIDDNTLSCVIDFKATHIYNKKNQVVNKVNFIAYLSDKQRIYTRVEESSGTNKIVYFEGLKKTDNNIFWLYLEDKVSDWLFLKEIKDVYRPVINVTKTKDGIGFLTKAEKGFAKMGVPIKADVYVENWKNASLQNSWSTSSGYQRLQFFKDSFGIVHFRGVIKGGRSEKETVIFTLPEAYRPSATTFLQVLLNDYSLGVVAVYGSGNIVVKGGNLTEFKKWTCFDGLTFRSK